MKKSLLLLALLVFAALRPGFALAQTGANVLTNIQRQLTWTTPADSVRRAVHAHSRGRARPRHRAAGATVRPGA